MTDRLIAGIVDVLFVVGFILLIIFLAEIRQ